MTQGLGDILRAKIDYYENRKPKTILLTSFHMGRKDFWGLEALGSPELGYLQKNLILNKSYAQDKGYKV